MSNNDLSDKVIKMENVTGYQTVDVLGYNPTTNKLGLKVNGADTVIPFSSDIVHNVKIESYAQRGNGGAQNDPITITTNFYVDGQLITTQSQQFWPGSSQYNIVGPLSVSKTV